MKSEELKIIKNEFERIKGMDYVKALRVRDLSVGATFEDLLRKGEKKVNLSQYPGLIVKIKEENPYFYTTLFRISLQEEYIKRLREKYGYVNVNKYKTFNVSVQANCSSFVGTRFLFKLYINKEEEKVYFTVMDKNYSVVEKKIYWTFEELKKKLNQKLKNMIILKVWTKKVDGVDYYKYYDIHFYQLKSFNNFLKLLEEGIIRLTINLDVYKSGPRKGQTHNRGIRFEIQEVDLNKLFEEIEI